MLRAFFELFLVLENFFFFLFFFFVFVFVFVVRTFFFVSAPQTPKLKKTCMAVMKEKGKKGRGENDENGGAL